MSKKKRKTRSQKEASSTKVRKHDISISAETREKREEEVIQDRVNSVKHNKKNIPDWASEKIDKDLGTILLYIGITLFIVAGIYIIIYQTDLLSPIFNKFNISY